MSRPAIDMQASADRPDARQSAAEQNILLAAKGGGITFIGKLFTFGSRFAITFVMARALGAEQYGLYNLAVTAFTLSAAVAAFGLDSALIRYIAIFAHRRDSARLWGTIQLGLGLTTLLSLLVGLGLFMLAQPIAEQIFHEPRLTGLLKISGFIVPFLTLNNTIAGATQGFKKMQYVTIARDITQPAMRLVLIIGLAIIGLSAGAALLVFALAIVVTTIMLVYFLNRLFSLRRPLNTGRREIKEIMGFSVPVFLSDLMTTFRGNIQTLLLGATNTVANVGIYAVAHHITMLGSMFQTAIGVASRPIISELYDRREWKQMGRMYQTTTKWAVTVNLPLYLILILFPTQILAIFGRSFTAASTALILLATAIMVDVSTGMCGIIIDMTGHTTWKLINSIVRLVLSIGLSVLLIPTWGVLGAAVATLIAISTINVLRMLQVFFLFRLLPHNASFAKPLTAGLVALSTVAALDYWVLEDAAPLLTGLLILLLIVIYVLIIVLLGLSEEDRIVLSRVRKRMGSLLSRNRNNDH